MNKKIFVLKIICNKYDTFYWNASIEWTRKLKEATRYSNSEKEKLNIEERERWISVVNIMIEGILYL